MSLQLIKMPDVGNAALTVIEISVSENTSVQKDQTLLVAESEKTTLEIPAPLTGIIKKLNVKVGDLVSTDQVMGEMEVEEKNLPTNSSVMPAQAGIQNSDASKIPNVDISNKEKLKNSESWIPAFAGMTQEKAGVTQEKAGVTVAIAGMTSIHAGPAVRRLAFELGVNLAQVKPTGPRDRILKEDIKAYVKQRLTQDVSQVSALPEIDFGQWGEIEKINLTTLAKTSAKNLQRSWSVIPHVTQFEEADISLLEASRKKINEQANIKITPLAFIMKAMAETLEKFPKFKASLTPAQDQLIFKKYCHIGFAVDTPQGLVVPVMRDVLEKTVEEIAENLQVLSAKAREKKLLPQEMQGACFTISSLGGLGGTQFTPIVNWPEVAILGVSRSQQKPVWDGQQFMPKLMLPLSLSYDHRVIDGADGVRFLVALKEKLETIAPDK